MIRLEEIWRRYLSDDVETTALHAINLHVGVGEFVAVMGPSGCGKSTLLNMLGTIDRPTTGRYYFGDHNLADMDEKSLARFRSEKLGFVFQSFNLIDELTVRENVELGLVYRRQAIADRRTRLMAAMDQVGIAHRADHFPHQLSGGQQQRAAIARAIVSDPQLILADEPTGNLDSANSRQVRDILSALNAAGTTIVMVTHSQDDADIAHRQITMLDGRIVGSTVR